MKQFGVLVPQNITLGGEESRAWVSAAKSSWLG